MESLRSAFTRLGCLIPMTLWPVMLWISAQGYYSWSIHRARALVSVGHEVFLLAHILSTVGVLFVLLGCGAKHVRLIILICILLNYLLMLMYIAHNTVVYL